MSEMIWKGKKRDWLGLPLTTTRYELYTDKMIVRSGFFTVTEDEIRLYRILDITMKRNLWQRILGLGTLHVCSTDATKKEFDMKNIRHPKLARDTISQAVEDEKERKHVYARESLHADYSEHDDHDDDHHDFEDDYDDRHDDDLDHDGH